MLGLKLKLEASPPSLWERGLGGEVLPPALLQPLPHPAATRRGVRLLLWRDDLLNPALPGNKARKLKYNLAAARAAGQQRLLTFGGAYSNHLRAVATAGQLYGFETTGLVRGDELATQPLNPSLAYCRAAGMRLHFLPRATYRRRAEPDFLAGLQAEFGPAYLLPEGGSNALALRGMAELVPELRRYTDFDAVAVAAGTGGTLAGLALGMRQAAYPARTLGVAALKGAAFVRADADGWLRAAGAAGAPYELHLGYHFGGYGRCPLPLQKFMAEFERSYGVRLDPVYNAKLLFGLLDLVERGHFAPGSTVVAVHTGGVFSYQ